MGSSNGVTRGQLRPYFSGRTPPFILVGTLIILIIFGFSYWSLNSQYNDLQVELHEFQDQLRAAAQKRLENEKHSSSLHDQLLTVQESSAKCKSGLEKKEEEIAEISQQLRDDLTRTSTQLEEKRMNLEKCEDDKLKKEGEFTRQQELTKQLDAENAELKKIQETLKEKINLLENELKQNAAEVKVPVQKQLSTSVPIQDVEPKITRVEENDKNAKSKNVEPKDTKGEDNETHEKMTAKNVEIQVTPANPDVGLPPGNDGGNDIQDNALPKNNLQQKDIQADVVNPGNDAKSLNGVQLGLSEDPKNNIGNPQQQYSSLI